MPVEKKYDVICVGQAVIDCIVRGREEDAYKPNVFRAENIALSTGGDAVNESFKLTAMGHRVRLVCGLGEDLAGNILKSEAARRGLDLSSMRVIEGMRTPIANLVVNRDGSRHSINSSATMLEGYLPEKEEVTGGKIVSFASLFRAPLDRPEKVRELMNAAHEDGAVICADTKLPTFRRMSFRDIEDVLPLIDYMFPNEKEAAYYTGQKDYPAMARTFREWGIKNVIIKTGPEGCYADTCEGIFSLPPAKVNVVDTTGAGDSFVAGFLSALLEKRNVRECLEAALLKAGECVQHMGA